ncbi:MAG: AMP-binding protein [Acidobacteria bacterium]|nr:MAG: AMP-binding protein [Acidobacteriota bacterium]
MGRRLLTEYIQEFRRHESEVAYAHRRGYRLLRWTYGEVASAAARFARLLESRGVGKGDRVLLAGGDLAEWAAVFWGCLLRGAAVVPLDRCGAPEFARRVADEVTPKLFARSHHLSEIDVGLPTLTLETLREALAPFSAEAYPPQDLRASDPVEIVFTSGTTAEPKGVVLTHENILSNLEPLEREIRKYLKYERPFHPLRFLNLLPLSHVFGQFMGLFVPPLLSATVIFLDTLNPSEVLRTIRNERVSVLVTVPRVLETLRDKFERDFQSAGKIDEFGRRLKAAEGRHFTRRWWMFRDLHRRLGWKFWALVSGGAALDCETETFWKRLGFAVIQGYGLTETTSLISVNHPFRLADRSVGRVLAGREIKLAPDGEILVRGGSVAAGYWQGRELRPVLDSSGWFPTGDRGELDAQGNLYFKGRTKDVIVTPEGMKVYPEDLEPVLGRQPEVRDCVVVGIPVGGNAEPCAVLILRDPEGVAEAAVRRANQSLAEFQQIRRWVIWPGDDFPRTATQKPRRAVILEAVCAQIANTSPGARPQLAAGTLRELLEHITGRKASSLRPEANLATGLGLSSMDRVELLSALEDRFQTDLNETRFAAATTVGELEKMLRTQAPERSDYAYPRWAQRWPVTWIRLTVYYLLAWPATLLLGYPAVRGRENLKGVAGPLLVVSNHVTSVDIGFILAALPPRYRHRLAVAMIGERLRAMRHPLPETKHFRRWVDQVSYALVVALFNVFPLPQQTGFRESFAYAGESVDRGYSVLVFPEGRRTPDGGLGPFQSGAGLLSTRLGIPILPAKIDGLYELREAGRRWARPGQVRVTIGAPVRVDLDADPVAVARDLERRIASMDTVTSV